MNIFAAFLATETDTDATAPTGWGGFLEYGLFRGDASVRDPEGMGGSPLLTPEAAPHGFDAK
jgi:hypothetical protein